MRSFCCKYDKIRLDYSNPVFSNHFKINKKVNEHPVCLLLVTQCPIQYKQDRKMCKRVKFTTGNNIYFTPLKRRNFFG